MKRYFMIRSDGYKAEIYGVYSLEKAKCYIREYFKNTGSVVLIEEEYKPVYETQEVIDTNNL